MRWREWSNIQARPAHNLLQEEHCKGEEESDEEAPGRRKPQNTRTQEVPLFDSSGTPLVTPLPDNLYAWGEHRSPPPSTPTQVGSGSLIFILLL